MSKPHIHMYLGVWYATGPTGRNGRRHVGWSRVSPADAFSAYQSIARRLV